MISRRTGRTVSAGFIRTKPTKCFECGKRGVSRKGWNCRYCGEIYVSRDLYEAIKQRRDWLAERSRQIDAREAVFTSETDQ